MVQIATAPENTIMRRVSTVLTIFALTGTVVGIVLPRAEVPAPIAAVSHKPDFSAAGIDPMPVGSAKQVARAKRIRASRKA